LIVSLVASNKLSPLEDKVRQLRADLNLLRDTIDEQNKTFKIIANKEVQSLQKFRAEFADSVKTFEKANGTFKRRYEDLELELDKLKKAIRSTANSAKIETIASIDKLRSEALETNQENFAIVLENTSNLSKPR
jgi:hypothetical protein